MGKLVFFVESKHFVCALSPDWTQGLGAKLRKRGRKHISVLILKRETIKFIKKSHCLKPRITIHMKQFSVIIGPV